MIALLAILILAGAVFGLALCCAASLGDRAMCAALERPYNYFPPCAVCGATCEGCFCGRCGEEGWVLE